MKKQIHLYVILLTFVLTIFSFANQTLVPSVNATYVEGPITQDTTWTLVDSPFIVSNDIIIYSNATLTIEPGVEVKFGGDFSITVSGKLYANGTDSKMIIFTSNKEQPEVGDWKTIKFDGTGTSALTSCSILYAKDGILIENGDVEIDNSTISLSQNGITAVNGEISIQNSAITNCYYNGINITDSEAIIQDNIIMGNQVNGICVTGNEQVVVQNNSILANGNGILLTGSYAANVNINQNRISANIENGIQIEANNHSGITILNNTVSSNYRGFYVLSPVSTYIGNNSISYNSIGFLYTVGSHVVNYSDIYGNEMGMDVLLGGAVNAEYNYWGDPTGPNHELLNPSGRGDPVGGDGVNLDFIFFLTKPVGIINSRPTANLLADKIWISRNNDIMFFASNSYDSDGRIDRYFLDFGDDSDSGWTTTSVFSHKYTIGGIYFANLRVMDDYGVVSSVTSVTINVNSQILSPLYVSLGLSNYTVREGEQVSVSVYVTNGTIAMQNARVTLFSLRGGEFEQSNGFTDISGYFVTNFTAPDLVEMASIRIVASASKDGVQYVDGSDYKYLQVSPFLSVQITVNPDTIKSEGTTQVTVHVESNGQPVVNASVTVQSSEGSLSSETGTTDLNGVFSLVFTAPQTTTLINVDITAIATKDRYLEGTGNAVVVVQPKVLVVEITSTTNVTISEAKINMTVHVEYESTPIAGANVTIATQYGELSKTTDLTDVYGNVTLTFTAPPVGEQTSIVITAHATMTGYAESESQLEITVNPRTFSIHIVTPTIESGKSVTITVLVACNEDGTAVAGATVTISSTDGSFELVTKTTDSTGACAFTFNAPRTVVDLPVNITVNVARSGYISGESQTTITVQKSTVQADGGWLLTTILLIIIPVVIVVIVVVLIKLKIITLSTEEEED